MFPQNANDHPKGFPHQLPSSVINFLIPSFCFSIHFFLHEVVICVSLFASSFIFFMLCPFPTFCLRAFVHTFFFLSFFFCWLILNSFVSCFLFSTFLDLFHILFLCFFLIVPLFICLLVNVNFLLGRKKSVCFIAMEGGVCSAL